MKKNTAYTIGSLIVLLICAFCFVILPAFTGADSRSQDQLPAFGKYNGKEIKYQEGTDFANFVSQYGQMFQSYGQQIDSSTYYYIFNYAFNATVKKMAYEDAAKASGFVAPETAVTRKMIPYFSDANGKYSAKLYRETDDKTKSDLRNSVTDSIYTSRYYDDVFGSDEDIVGTDALYGLKESDAELDFLTDLGSKKRGFNMATFSMADYPEEEALKYGKNNAAKFNKYDLSVITVNDKSEAENLVKRISNNEISFEDAISEYSDKIYSDTEGKVTNSYQYQLENILTNKEDLAKLTDLSTGSVTGLLEPNSTYSIFKANSTKVAPDFDSDDVKTTVTNYLKGYESTIIEDYFTAKANSFIADAKATNFKSACEKDGIENVEIAPFPLNYGSVNIAKSVDTSLTGLSGADTNENFLKTAFNLKKEEISAPMVMNDYVVVLRYTTEEIATADDLMDASSLSAYDEDSANTFVMNSDKLENNFIDVYFNHLMKD